MFRFSPDGLQGLPQPAGARRHVEIRYTDGMQCIHHRIHEGRHRARDAALAHPLGAERVGRGRYRVIGYGEPPDQARARHRVVHEATGQELAGRVVHALLEENVARALGDAALHLAFDDLVIDDGPDVVAGDVGDDLALAGLRIDLYLGDVAAVRESGAHLGPPREIEVELAGVDPRQLVDAHLAVGPLDSVRAGLELDVLHRALEVIGGEVHAVLHDLLRRPVHRAAEAVQRAR